MVGLPSSHRTRRRLLWLLGSVTVVGLLVAVGLKWSNTAPKAEEEFESGPGWSAPAQPKRERFTARRRQEALNVAAHFIATAVARDHVGESWDLTAPSLRAGYTRKQWASGDIPVVPFPVGTARWELDYSFTDSVGLKVAIFPKKGADEQATVFLVDLRKVGRGKRARWLVESFQPDAQLAGTENRGPKTSLGFPDLGTRPGDSQLSMIWLLIPFGLLSLIVLVPLTVGVLNWYRGARAEREYLRSKSR